MAMMHAPAMSAEPMTTAPPTVCGFPLEPGERVIYFRDKGHPSVGGQILVIVLGIITALAIVGLFLIYAGIFHKKFHTRAEVVTSKRLLNVMADGSAKIRKWEEVKEIIRFRYRSGAVELRIGTVSYGYNTEIEAIIKSGGVGAEKRPAVGYPA